MGYIYSWSLLTTGAAPTLWTELTRKTKLYRVADEFVHTKMSYVRRQFDGVCGSGSFYTRLYKSQLWLIIVTIMF